MVHLPLVKQTTSLVCARSGAFSTRVDSGDEKYSRMIPFL